MSCAATAKDQRKLERLPLGEEILRPTFRRERRALSAASGRSRAATRPGGGRSPARWSPPPSSSIPSASRAGSNDSKKLTMRGAREALRKICATAEVAVAFGSTARIDRDNILHASLWALARAVRALPLRPQAGLRRRQRPHRLPAAIARRWYRGDALVLSIAAASIVAKVTRDRLMMRLGLAHPGYGFERHMGYSVPEHFAALTRLGPTIHHRRSFAPVAAVYGETGRRGAGPATLPSAGRIAAWFAPCSSAGAPAC